MATKKEHDWKWWEIVALAAASTVGVLIVFLIGWLT